MDEDRILHEEYNAIPEHVIPPEYTPEYPDVSFFQESYVTAREENIFQGETPPGEEDLRALKKEEQQKRARFSWLRDLLSSALRGGAAIFGICALVVTLVSGAELPEDSPWTPVKNKVAELKREPMRQLDDYGPGELKQLWTGDPEGPHQYDFEHAHLRREASCEEDGILEYYCTECGIALPEIVPGGHVPAASVRENEQQPDCIHEGGWDDIVYCSVCHGELSREHHSIPATGHTSAEAVMENVVGAVCTEGGSFDTVVYCAVCHAELSREHFTTEALGHTPAEAVKENEKAPSCTGEGSYDSVVYCSVCDAELSRETVPVAALGHHPGFAVKENEKEPSCTKEGAYDSVIYCMVCDEELSREKVTLPVIAHIETQDIEENRVDPDCVTEGSAEIAVYCDVCGLELSREDVVLEALGHTEDEPLVENETEPTCTEEGGFDEVIYCMVCGEEVSRVHTVIEATGHTEGTATEENRVAATCTKEGGYDTVIYCSVCGEELSRTHSTIAKIAHTPASAVRENVRNATCTATGSYDEVVYCSVCRTEITRTTRTVAALGHNYTNTVTAATCTARGYTTHTCSRCQDSYTDTYTAALGHNYSNTVTAPTCTAQGYTTHTCSRCGNSYKDNYTSALGHSPDDSNMENYHAATCLTDGYYDVITRCTVCNTVLSSQRYDIAAHGHTFNVNNGGELRCSNSDCNTAGGAPAVTLSYIKSNNTFYMTMNSDFVKVLDGSKTIKYRVEGALKGTTRYTYCHNDDRYWTTDGTTFRQSVNVEADQLPYAFDSGDTVVCRLVLQYILGTNAIYIYSPEIEITIP